MLATEEQTETAVTPKRRRRRTRSRNLNGPIVDCESVATSKLISVFLRALSPKEKGFALRLLLQLAKEQQATPVE